MGKAANYSWDDLLAAMTSIQEARYAIAAIYGLQIYELLVGINQEFNLIHRAKWTSIKIAYLLCRYYPLCFWPVVIWAYVGDHSADACRHIARPVHGFLAPCQFFSQGVMLMRAYAFSGRDWRILILLGFCYASLLAVDIWAFCTHVYVPPRIFYDLIGPSGCFPNYGAGIMASKIGYTTLASTLMDLISLAVVIVHCRRSRLRGVCLARYFMNQGLGAFAFVTLVNVGAAVAFFRPRSFHTGIGLPLILVVSNLVACRVILQLRRRVSPTDSEISRRHSILVHNAFADTPRPNDVWLMDQECD